MIDNVDIEIIDKKNFTIEGQEEFCPYDPEKIGHLMNIDMNDNNRKDLLYAFHMACEQYEQNHGLAILLQTISISKERSDLILPKYPIRCIRSLSIRSNGRGWKCLYKNHKEAYKEEIFDLTENDSKTEHNQQFSQYKTSYGGRIIELDKNIYPSNQKVRMNVIYEAGYHYRDKTGIPGATLNSLKRIACDHYYNGYSNQNSEKYEEGIV